jgi:hypothetical protein
VAMSISPCPNHRLTAVLTVPIALVRTGVWGEGHANHYRHS